MRVTVVCRPTKLRRTCRQFYGGLCSALDSVVAKIMVKVQNRRLTEGLPCVASEQRL